MKPQSAALGTPRLPKTPTHLYTVHPKPSLLGTKKPQMSSNPPRPSSSVLLSLLSSPSADQGAICKVGPHFKDVAASTGGTVSQSRRPGPEDT